MRKFRENKISEKIINKYWKCYLSRIVLCVIFFRIFFAFFFRIFLRKISLPYGDTWVIFFWKKHENEKIDFCQVLVWVCIKHWDIMKLASTWCVLDPERVCSELNELFFLNFTWKVHFMVQVHMYFFIVVVSVFKN